MGVDDLELHRTRLQASDVGLNQGPRFHRPVLQTSLAMFGAMARLIALRVLSPAAMVRPVLNPIQSPPSVVLNVASLMRCLLPNAPVAATNSRRRRLVVPPIGCQ